MNKINLTSITLIIVLLLTSLGTLPQPALAQTQLPDLAIVNAWQPGNQIQYIVKNNGPGNISGVIAPVSFYNALFVDGKLVAQDHVTSSLAAGQQVERTFNYEYQVTPPSNTIRIIADYQQDIEEGNEQNNIWEDVWQVIENLPDLTVEKFEVGEGNKLSVTIKNIDIGPLPTGWSALGQIWINGQDKGNFSLQNPTFNIDGGIAASGGSATYLLPWDILEPTLVACAVDITSSINESNEQNNYKEEKVVPPAVNLPDLVIAGIEYDQKTGNVSCIIKNTDAGDTSTSFVCSLSLSDPFVYEESTVQATLKGGEVFTLYFKSSVQPLGQTVTIQVCADTLNQIKESNEQNNCLEKTVTIEALPTTVPPPPPSTEKPVLALVIITDGPRISQITSNSVEISWTTNLDSDSRVSYDTHTSKFGNTQADSKFSQKHQINLKGLTPGTTYQFTVESRDKTGNVVQSRPMVFVTLPAEDKEKPSVSLSLSPMLAGKKAVIEATAQDNTAVNRVIFYVDGRPAFIDYAAPFRWECDTTLFGEGKHSFGASAHDAAGNISEIAKSGDIQNRLAEELSPVNVRIISPSGEDEIYGISSISAEIAHDLDLKIDRIEFVVDGTIIHPIDFDPPTPLTMILCPVYITSYRWDTDTVSPGSHVINVRVRDEVGNWGSGSRRVVTVEPPIPTISVTREVQRHGNYFEVTLNLRNDGEVDVSNLVINDTCHSFQSIRDVLWRRGTSGDFSPLLPFATVRREAGSTSNTILEVSLGVLNPGETKGLRYFTVPILRDNYDPYSVPTIGAEMTLNYETRYGEYVQSYPLSYSCFPGEFGEAVHAADYLIITCPAYLDDFNTADESNALLSKMAELAKEKNGLLGYVSESRANLGAGAVKMLLQDGGGWSIQMTPSWVNSGYLLIVGEIEIIPAWTWEGIPLSDYPYSDTRGDERPELRVGRIVGNTASELAIPITNSLNGVYYGSRALLVSGPEDTWEPNVKNSTIGRSTMMAAGLDVDIVHTEYWTSDYAMLAEALRIKKAPQGSTELKDLAIFLLKHIGPPEGAEEDDDLSGYSVNQLGAWLLWARNELPATTTYGDAISNAGVIVSNAGGLSSVMWSVMKDMLMRKDTERIFTTKELTAWLLWEELSPRGPLTADQLGSSTISGVSHRLAEMTLLELVNQSDVIITNSRLVLAKGRAEAIQAANTSRGGTYSPWSYVYCADSHGFEYERSQAIKREAAEGKDLIFFYGHGDPGGWCAALTDWIGSGSEVDPIDFGGRNPIIGAFACDTGNYRQGPQEEGDIVVNNNPSISERLLQNGAAVYMGATVPALYAHMNELITTKFWYYWSGTSSIGDILRSLKVNVLSLDDSWNTFAYYYNLYGDPKYGQR
jgi:hypothetical protein